MEDKNKISYATLHLIESEWEALRQYTGMKTKVEALHFVVAQALGARPVKGGIKGGK